MSKPYELVMPAVFDVSARAGSVWKNSCTVPGINCSFSGSGGESMRRGEPRPRYHRAPMTKVEIALPGQAGADALAIPVAQPLGRDGAGIVDEKLGGRLAKLGESGELRGDRGETVVLHLNGELEAPRL